MRLYNPDNAPLKANTAGIPPVNPPVTAYEGFVTLAATQVETTATLYRIQEKALRLAALVMEASENDKN